MATSEDSRRGPKRSVHFSAKLRHARESADLTQEALAAKAGVSIDSIRRAEHEKPVALETARAIGGGLDISFEILLRSEVKSGPNTNLRPRKELVHEDASHYKLYSDGELIQRMSLNIAPYIEDLFVVYPVTFPNEVTRACLQTPAIATAGSYQA